MATKYGTSQNDTLFAGNGGDTLWGFAGNDYLYGGNGNDFLDGGAGDDDLWGGSGNDSLWGGPGNDTLGGSNGDDTLSGEDGNDSLWGFYGNDFLWGGSGNDTLEGDDGNDTLDGDEGNDQLWGNEGNDQLWGSEGNDLLYGGAGNDTLYGDSSIGEAGSDTLYGEDGNDDLSGDAGNDFLYGGAGDDTLWGWDGNDSLSGGTGNDTLWGNEGNDYLYGGTGNDSLLGRDGNDTFIIYKGDGYDVIADATAEDTLKLGPGIAASDLKTTLNGSDLVLTISGNQAVTLQYWYATNRLTIATLNDGTTFTLDPTPAWFDTEVYMGNKLEQLGNGWNEQSLIQAFNNAGYGGKVGSYLHFLKWGNLENVSPNQYFDSDYYFQSKLVQLQTTDPNGHWTLASTKQAFANANLSAWDHYMLYGVSEGVNPCGNFSTSKYLNAKLDELHRDDPSGNWTMSSLITALQQANLNPVQHYMLYGVNENLDFNPDAGTSVQSAALTIVDDAYA